MPGKFLLGLTGVALSAVVTYGVTQNNANKEIDNLKNQNAELATQLENEKLEKQKYYDALQESALTLEAKQILIDSLTTSLNLTKSELTQAQLNYANKQTELEQKQSELDEVNANIATLQNELNSVTADKVSIQSQLDTALENKTMLETQIATLTTERDNLQIQVNELTEENNVLKSTIESLQAQIEELQNQATITPTSASYFTIADGSIVDYIGPTDVEEIIIPKTYSINGTQKVTMEVSLSDYVEKLERCNFNFTFKAGIKTVTCSSEEQFSSALESIDNALRSYSTGTVEYTVPKCEDGTDYQISIIGDDIASIGGLTNFKGKIKILDNIQSISALAFAHSQLSELDLTRATNLESVGGQSFIQCTNLLNVDFSKCLNMESIADYAFESCTLLKNVVLPNNLKGISNNSFNSCYALEYTYYENDTNLKYLGSEENPYLCCMGAVDTSSTSATISDSTTIIANYAFDDYENLAEISLPSKLQIIGICAFQSCLNLTNVDLSLCKDLVRIGAYAFTECSSLTSIDLTQCSYLQNIGGNAFGWCSKLENIQFPKNNLIVGIEESTFVGCRILTSIDLSGCINLNYIAGKSFRNCSGLLSIYIPAGSVRINSTSADYSPFKGCSTSLKIYCGAESKPDNWSEYWNYCSSSTALEVQWGVTPEEYAEIVSGGEIPDDTWT